MDKAPRKPALHPDAKITSWTIARPTPAQLVRAAALLADAPPELAEAGGKGMVDRASELGIDLDLLWSVFPDERPGCGSLSGSQTEPTSPIGSCLIVLAAGRAATVFATPRVGDRCPVRALAQCITRAMADAQITAQRTNPGRVTGIMLFQTLAELDQGAMIHSFELAGFTRLTDLEYLARNITRMDRADAQPGEAGNALPPGFTIRAMGMIEHDERRRLITAIQDSYQDTLDCPELCKLRTTDDVLDAHCGAGDGDTSMWRLVEYEGSPVGCCLVSRTPSERIADLIYIGLAPSARGHGLGRVLVTHALSLLAHRRIPMLRCAVDTRNAPAQRLYASLGFKCTESRTALIFDPRTTHTADVS